MPDADDYGIKATVTSHEILESIRTGRGTTLTEIADELGISKSAVHKHLATLQSIGYVRRFGDEYQIGLRLVSFGVHARQREEIYNAAKAQVVKLANQTGEQTCLVVPDQSQTWQCISIYSAMLTDPDVENQEGNLRPFHSTAGGKALLSQWDESRLSEFLADRELTAETENTITDADELRAELQAIRDQGVAYDRREHSNDVHGVAAPILDNEAVPLGAIEILGPATRMSGKRLEEDTVGLLVSGAKKIENKLAIE